MIRRVLSGLFLLSCVLPLAAMQPPAHPDLPPDALGADGYRESNMRSPTPATSPAAWTVTTEEAQELLRAGVTPIDVYRALYRPAGDGLDEAWLVTKPRQHLPGSAWLPNVGHAELDPAIEAYLQRSLQQLSSSDSEHPFLFYCKADCWHSWNAVLRVARMGYSRLYWYPQGTDGWAEAGHTLVPATPLPLESPLD